MRKPKKASPTLIEIIDYWLEQKKNNTGRMDIQHYMKVCHAKARTLRWNETDKTWNYVGKK
jgi:hypothetical protein